MSKLHKDLENKEFWYKEITLIPNRLPDFERDEVDLTTNFTENIFSKTLCFFTNRYGYRRDVRYRKDMETRLREVMTPRERLSVAKKLETVDKNDILVAEKILRSHNLDTLPIVDEEDKIIALLCDTDIKKIEKYSLVTKNENNQLRVFIAVESQLALAKERIKKRNFSWRRWNYHRRQRCF